MTYLYETHLHTSQSSACGGMLGRDHVRYYKDIGFRGIFVTDHFFGGNTAVDRSLPWSEWVNRFCAGYEDARDEGERIGLDVFFGWEQGYGDDEYLIYGLDKQWLLNHPVIARCSRREQMELVHDGGGCVIQAHPFRTRDYIHRVRIGLRFCDGVEVANAGNGQPNDVYAYHFARELGLVMTAGSDNHRSPTVKGEKHDPIFGVALDTPLTSSADYASRILRRESIGLYVPEERITVAEEEKHIESFWLDENESPVPTNREWLNSTVRS